MLFVTEIFLVFFLVVHLVFWGIPGRFRNFFLTIASFVFYATWSVPFAFHLTAIIALNYGVMEIWRKNRSSALFYGLQILNLLNIGVFKYYYFFADILGRVTGNGALLQPTLLQSDRLAGTEVLLPLAISFYTFQIMSYGIDIRRGVYDEKHPFSDVLLFIFFFPQLIAGPIMRSQDLLPQIRQLRTGESSPDPEQLRKGIWLILVGILKKVVVADQLLMMAAPVLGGKGDTGPLAYSTGSIWAVLLASFFMIYTDFSAYSDLARGFGATLGFDVPINFKAPFVMRSINDFWQRWHLTFSLWIRDYIFIPLGGSRVGEFRGYLNLTITFFLGGLWHGASWTFVLWGTMMGVLLSIESFLRKRGIKEWPSNPFLKVFRLTLVWILIVSSGAFFFAPNLTWSMEALQRMFVFKPSGKGALEIADLSVLWFSIPAVAFFNLVEEKTEWFLRFRKWEVYLLPIASFIVILAVTQFAGSQQDFFYFQF